MNEPIDLIKLTARIPGKTIQPTRLDMERAEAEKLQERTDYMLNAALLQVKEYKERLEKCEAALKAERDRCELLAQYAGALGLARKIRNGDAAHAALEEK